MLEPSPILIDADDLPCSAFLDFLADFRAVGESGRYGTDAVTSETFAAYVRRVKAEARGEGVPEGYVPSTQYWLMVGDRIVGGCGIRHRLTEGLTDFGGHIGYTVRPSDRRKGYGTLMLRLALVKARELGIIRVRLTCDSTNVASARVIEKNGGVLDTESYSPGRRSVSKRYWIDLA